MVPNHGDVGGDNRETIECAFVEMEKAISAQLVRYRSDLNHPECINTIKELYQTLVKIAMDDDVYLLLRIRTGKMRKLTKRQQDVGLLASKGKADKNIATDLGISKFTVRGHIHNIYKALDFNSRARLARYMFLVQLVQEGIETLIASSS